MSDDTNPGDGHEEVLRVETYRFTVTPVTVWRTADGGHAYRYGPARPADPSTSPIDAPHWDLDREDWLTTTEAAELAGIPARVAVNALELGVGDTPAAPALDADDAVALLEAARRQRAATLVGLELADRGDIPDPGPLTPSRDTLAAEAAALSRAIDRLAALVPEAGR